MTDPNDTENARLATPATATTTELNTASSRITATLQGLANALAMTRVLGLIDNQCPRADNVLIDNAALEDFCSALEDQLESAWCAATDANEALGASEQFDPARKNSTSTRADLSAVSSDPPPEYASRPTVQLEIDELITLLYDTAAIGDLLAAATHDQLESGHLDGGTVLQTGLMIDRNSKQAIEIIERIRDGIFPIGLCDRPAPTVGVGH